MVLSRPCSCLLGKSFVVLSYDSRNVLLMRIRKISSEGCSGFEGVKVLVVPQTKGAVASLFGVGAMFVLQGVKSLKPNIPGYLLESPLIDPIL